MNFHDVVVAPKLVLQELQARAGPGVSQCKRSVAYQGPKLVGAGEGGELVFVAELESL